MRLDIIIPAYNEEHRIGRTLAGYRRVCDDPGTRFLVALDQCTDRTAEVVGQHQEADRRVQAFNYPKLGKGGVILETLRRSDADLVGFVDADGATPPAELLRLAGAAATAGAAVASRWHPTSVLSTGRPLSRRVASRGFAIAVRRLFDLRYLDTQCGAKVLRRDVADLLVPYLSARDFVFDVDLLLVARALELPVAELPTIWIDQRGSRLDAVADGRRMAASLLRLWLHHRVLPVALPPSGPARTAAGAGGAGIPAPATPATIGELVDVAA